MANSEESLIEVVDPDSDWVAVDSQDEPLGVWESLRTMLSESPTMAMGGLKRTAGGLLGALDTLIPEGVLPNYLPEGSELGADLIRRGTAQQQEVRDNSQIPFDSWWSTGRDVASGALQTAPTLLGAAGAAYAGVPSLLAGVGAGLGLGGAMGVGNKYADLVSRGVSDEEAAAPALQQGAVEGLLNLLPVGYALKSGAPLLKKLATGGGIGGLMGAISEFSSLNVDESAGVDLSSDEAMQRLTAATGIGSIFGAGASALIKPKIAGGVAKQGSGRMRGQSYEDVAAQSQITSEMTTPRATESVRPTLPDELIALPAPERLGIPMLAQDGGGDTTANAILIPPLEQQLTTSRLLSELSSIDNIIANTRKTSEYKPPTDLTVSGDIEIAQPLTYSPKEYTANELLSKLDLESSIAKESKRGNLAIGQVLDLPVAKPTSQVLDLPTAEPSQNKIIYNDFGMPIKESSAVSAALEDLAPTIKISESTDAAVDINKSNPVAVKKSLVAKRKAKKKTEALEAMATEPADLNAIAPEAPTSKPKEKKTVSKKDIKTLINNGEKGTSPDLLSLVKLISSSEKGAIENPAYIIRDYTNNFIDYISDPMLGDAANLPDVEKTFRNLGKTKFAPIQAINRVMGAIRNQATDPSSYRKISPIFGDVYDGIAAEKTLNNNFRFDLLEVANPLLKLPSESIDKIMEKMAVARVSKNPSILTNEALSRSGFTEKEVSGLRAWQDTSKKTVSILKKRMQAMAEFYTPERAKNTILEEAAEMQKGLKLGVYGAKDSDAYIEVERLVKQKYGITKDANALEAVASARKGQFTAQAVKELGELWDGAETFAPLSRFGDYWMSYEIEGKPYREHYEDKIDFIKRKKELSSKVEKYKDGRIEAADKSYAGLPSDMAAKIENLDSNLYANLLRSSSEGADGFSQHLIDAKFIPGYSRDWTKVVHDYINSAASFSARGIHKPLIMESLNLIPDKVDGKALQAKKFLKGYVDDQYGETPQWLKDYKHLAAIKFLAGTLRQSTLQMSSLLTTTHAHLTGHVGYSKATKSLIKGATQAAIKAEKLPAETQMMLKQAVRDGVFSYKFIEELGQSGHSYNKLTNILMLTTTAPDTFSRKAAFLSGVDVADKLGIRGADKYAFARGVVDKTLFLGDKANTPAMFRGNLIKELVGHFRIYSYKYAKFLKDLALNTENLPHQKQAIAAALGNIGMVGGLMGMPGLKQLMAISRAAGANPESDIREVIAELGGGETAQDLVAYGAPSLAGLNLSGSLAFEMPQAEKGAIPAIAGVLGTPAGLIKSAERATSLLREGNTYRGIAEIAPDFIRSPMLAAEAARTGNFKDAYGANIAEATPFTIAARAGGFQPLEVSKYYEQKNQQSAINSRIDSVVKRFNNKIVDAIITQKSTGDTSNIDEVMAEIQKHNNSMIESGRPELAYDYRGREDSIKARVLAKLSPQQSLISKSRKAGRPEVAKIIKSYGE